MQIKNKSNKAQSQTPKLPPIQASPHASGLPSKLPPGLSSPSTSLLTDWLYAHNVKRVIAFHLPAEKYTVPATTSHEIGWRWDEKNGGPGGKHATLERYCVVVTFRFYLFSYLYVGATDSVDMLEAVEM